MSDLEDAVRRWAMGVYPVEAGAELLIRQGKTIYEGAPWLRQNGPDVGQRTLAIEPETLWVKSVKWIDSRRMRISLIES